MNAQASFELNGRRVELADTDPTESLLRWLRRAHVTGTKEGCADGDCGACTVALIERTADGQSRFQSVNSCLLPMGAVCGREVYTVEALADGDQLHPVQTALVDCAGSQCGYCTPGFVMSLFAGYYADALSDHTTEGNLCRCTGYRPIRAATAQIDGLARPADRFHAVLAREREPLTDASFTSFLNPTTLAQAMAFKSEHPQSAWIAGATDLGVNLSHGRAVAPRLIALDRVAELNVLEISESEVRIGAGVSLSRIEVELAGIFPPLDQMLPWFAAQQVRNRATFGGNLGSASPIGDLLPILLALDASIELAGPSGHREIAADAYFLGYRKTARADDELIVAVRIPRSTASVVQAGAGRSISAAYKVAKRQTDDISIVAAVFALALDAAGVVTHARLAYGGMSAVPLRAKTTEAFLLGGTLSAERVSEAVAILGAEFSPLSDHRAGADYRRALSGNLLAKFVAEHCL